MIQNVLREMFRSHHMRPKSPVAGVLSRSLRRGVAGGGGCVRLLGLPGISEGTVRIPSWKRRRAQCAGAGVRSVTFQAQ